MSGHDLELNTDFEGWVTAICSCGWQEGPFDASPDAVDSWGDHREAARGTER